MSNTEREKRLDELNRKLGITQPKKLVESDLEDIEEREWLKKKLGYEQHWIRSIPAADCFFFHAEERRYHWV
jgi:hypothetical protein